MSYIGTPCCLTFRSSLPNSTSSKAEFDTLINASRGHSTNQSMVQQLTSDGNIRHRDRNELPTGLMHSTICRLFLKNVQKILHNICCIIPSTFTYIVICWRYIMHDSIYIIFKMAYYNIMWIFPHVYLGTNKCQYWSSGFKWLGG